MKTSFLAINSFTCVAVSLDLAWALQAKYSASGTLEYIHILLSSESVVSNSPLSTRLPSQSGMWFMMPLNGAFTVVNCMRVWASETSALALSNLT